MTFKRWQSIKKKPITKHSKHKKLENQNWIKIKPRIWRLWKRNVLRRPPHLYYFTQCKLLWRSLYLDNIGSKWDIFLSKTKFWWDLLWYESKKNHYLRWSRPPPYMYLNAGIDYQIFTSFFHQSLFDDIIISDRNNILYYNS